MTNEIRYKRSVYRDLKKLQKEEAIRVMDTLEKELSQEKGTPLKGQYKGLYRLRVGDYRVIYYKTGNVVEVGRISHRRQTYK